jgi:hypothetical protein
MGRQPCPVTGPRTYEARIQPTFGERLELSRGLHRRQPKLHPRMASTVFPQQARQDSIHGHRCHIPNLYLAELAASREAPDLLGPVQLTHGGLRFRQKQSSRVSERHCGPLATVQETSAKCLLQPLDL